MPCKLFPRIALLTTGRSLRADEVQAAAQTKAAFDRKELALFWKLLPSILQRASPESRLQDLAVYRHLVTDTILPADWEDPDMLVSSVAVNVFPGVIRSVFPIASWQKLIRMYTTDLIFGRDSCVYKLSWSVSLSVSQGSAKTERHRFTLIIYSWSFRESRTRIIWRM